MICISLCIALSESSGSILWISGTVCPKKRQKLRPQRHGPRDRPQSLKPQNSHGKSMEKRLDGMTSICREFDYVWLVGGNARENRAIETIWIAVWNHSTQHLGASHPALVQATRVANPQAMLAMLCASKSPAEPSGPRKTHGTRWWTPK